MNQPKMAGQEKKYFGNLKLQKRNKIILDVLSDSPNSVLSEALGDNGSDRCYEFWKNDLVNPSAISAQHKEEAFATAAKCDEVLVIQDTTDINYTGHKGAEQLGHNYAKDGNYVFVHTTLLSTIEGLPLGIVDQLQWTRDKEDYGKKHNRKQKSSSEKESSKWQHCISEVRRRVPKSTKKIFICDRESDIYDFFISFRNLDEKLLIRIAQDRQLSDSSHIKEAINLAQECGEFELVIKSSEGSKTRTAKLGVKYCSVEITPPQNRTKEKLPNFKATIIKAYEKDSPESEESIEWFLLTTLEVNSFAEATRCIELYSKRWLIERFHYTLKSGCQIEKLRLDGIHSIMNSIATYSIVAFRIMYITYLSRFEPDKECTAIISEDEYEALYFNYNPKEMQVPKKMATVSEVVLWIAILGGYRDRKNTQPGLKVLWRGLTHLLDLTNGYTIAKARFTNCQRT